MSRRLTFFFLLLFVSVHAGGAPTSSTMGVKPSTGTAVEQALQKARLLSRPVVLYFQMQGCSWCRRFESEVLSQETVKVKLGGFEMVKADIFEDKNLALRFGIRGAPAFVLLDPSGNPAARWTGFLDAEKFLKFLATATAPGAPPDPGSLAAGAPGPDVMVTPPVITKLRKGSFAVLSESELAEFALLSADARTRFLSDEILQKQELPSRAFLPLLRHKLLAVRLATLQLLEDRSGETFGFDAWTDNSPSNREAFALWEAWANSAQSARPPSADPETLAGHLNELLSDDVVRSQRGFRALLRVGEAGVPEVVRFEQLNPTLTAGQKGRLRELRCAIVLAGLRAQEAEPLSHRLVFGNLDVRIQAMQAVSSLGPATLPLLDPFLTGSEPLEREAAVECVLRAGQNAAFPRVASLLQKETDANVLHAAIRKLGDTEDLSAAALIEPFIRSENEDLSIASLESLAKLKAADSMAAILTALEDPRWRVRVAALNAVADLKLKGAGDKVIRLLSDPDEFVRISAIQAASKMELSNTQAVMEKLFIEQDAMKPAIVQSYSRMNGRIPDSFLAALEKSSADVVLSVIGSLPDADSNSLPLLKWAAAHKNDDIACAALRLVASEGVGSQDIIESALLSGNPRRIQTVLQSAVIERNEVKKNLPTANQVTFDNAKDQNVPSDRIAFRWLASAVEKARFTDETDRLNADLILAQLGDPAAVKKLAAKLPTLTATQRTRLANALSIQRHAQTRPLFESLLNDPEGEVRRRAVYALFEDGFNASCVRLLFDVLQKPGSRLHPPEALHYRLSSSYSLKPPEIPAYRAVYRKALQSTRDPAVQILALYLLGHVWDESCTADVTPFLSSENPWLRRAAAFALGRNSPDEVRKYRDQILSDTSPYVRAAYPAAFIQDSFSWKTYFTDSESDSNSEGNSSSSVSLDAEDEQLIRKLMEDPDPGVQMMAGLCLFTHSVPFDTGKFFALVKQSPDARYLSYTFRNVFQKNLDKMPDEYARLVPLIGSHGDDRLKTKIANRFPSPDPAVSQSVPPVVINSRATPLPIRPAAHPAPADAEIPLVYFSKPGCSHCARVKAMLERVAESFPELKVVEFNINKNQSMELNESLSRRFGVPENLRLVAPSVFTSAGFLVSDDIVDERVGDLIQRARDPEYTPLNIDEATRAESPAAARAIAERYARINPAVIVSAGILDGLNPCAFATIIFLLSYLQIARKTPREMAQIGIAYVAGVFSAYFLLGLGLSELVARIVVFRKAALVLNVGMGLFALLIAVLSFRDGIRCLQGRLQDISLQLPAFLKDRIRGVIRKTVPHRGFVVAAFGVGAFISLLELACTGQVYAPTILYMIQAGQGGAVGYLLLYNVAFILPLTVIFIMVFFGLTSGKLTTFLQGHAAVVKFAMALLFFVLAFVLFAREWHG
jgi:HEAT repeat protein/thioredoxin-related protein/cytochrome c biogenesis protein CcdA